MKCKKCGMENDSYSTVCINCGEPLTPGFIMCPSCGKIIKEGSTICPRCNNKIYEKAKSLLSHSSYTTKYIVKAPLSLITSLSIMLFMVYSLSYNIVLFMIKIKKEYMDEQISELLLKLVTIDIRPLVLIFCTILSVITFVSNIRVKGKIKDPKELERRLLILKCEILADVTAFIVYFFVSFWPCIFEKRLPLYYVGGLIGLAITVISIITLPFFFKNSKVRTR